jgi:bifunctional DNA-binding transcriptional regulator/antitoxin component of YhaV-PrlF toxin-antitoxin module
MGSVIVEVASVSDSGFMALPIRVREALGMKGGGREVFFVDPGTKRALAIHEARRRVPDTSHGG